MRNAALVVVVAVLAALLSACDKRSARQGADQAAVDPEVARAERQSIGRYAMSQSTDGGTYVLDTATGKVWFVAEGPGGPMVAGPLPTVVMPGGKVSQTGNLDAATAPAPP